MRRLRSAFIAVLGSAVILTTALLLWSYLNDRSEARKIRSRYAEMRLALSSNDTNSARMLFAPARRASAHRSFDMLERFAKPLGKKSAIRVSGSSAAVCPEPIFHYWVIPGGHTIEMIRIKDEWFFTGSLHID